MLQSKGEILEYLSVRRYGTIKKGKLLNIFRSGGMVQSKREILEYLSVWRNATVKLEIVSNFLLLATMFSLVQT